MDKHILFRTLHGSRLYGLANENSDYDYYTVVDKVKNARAKYAKHTIVDGLDSVVVDFGTWVEQMKHGTPQALEAAFSPMAEVDHIAEFRNDLVIGYSAEVYCRYLNTIKSFCYSEKDPYKRKRHALRLALNMRDLRRYGRFNPTLDPRQVALISKVAELSADEVYSTALDLAWSA